MEIEKKLSWFIRIMAAFLAAVSLLAVVGVLFLTLTEGISALLPVGGVVSIAFAYVSAVIAVTGSPPRLLRWTANRLPADQRDNTH
jgi:hypothetical protein